MLWLSRDCTDDTLVVSSNFKKWFIIRYYHKKKLFKITSYIPQ